MSENYLPLILVSAVDFENASKLISEIIDNEVMDTDKNLRGGRVWRIINKYYRADVELCAAPDGAAPPPAAQRLEAHVLHVADQECAAEAAEARWAGAGAAARGAEVRLLAVEGARTPAALAGWARRRGYEAVPLAERAPPDGDAAGAARLREALHAHPWRGLARLDRAQSVDSGAGAACGGEAEAAQSDSEAEEAEEAAAVERAEAFVEALGALADAGGGAADAGGGAADDTERRARAERLVAAFCRALGAELQL